MTRVEITRMPVETLKQITFQVERTRAHNGTHFESSLSYELVNGKSNSLQSSIVMDSNLLSSSIVSEVSLIRPEVNVRYENRFNKNNGKLQHMCLRLGKLLRLSIDKEDSENRNISISFANPDESKYNVESTKSTSNGIRLVKSKLILKPAQVLSEMESSFDSNRNVFQVRISPVKANSNKVYLLDFGMYNESLATATVSETVSGQRIILGQAQLGIFKQANENDLVLNLKWNRVWSKIKSDVLNEQEASASTNENYNSYFGDVYAVLSEDLKPTVLNVRETRKEVRSDFNKVAIVLADFYSTAIPSLRKRFDSYAAQDSGILQNIDGEYIPLYKRAFRRFNGLAENLNALRLSLKPISQRLADLIPRLPVFTYNPERLTKDIPPFDNDLEVRRPTLKAHNLYQFSAEYRERVRSMAERVLNLKNSILRNMGTLRGLYNKYKLRSLSSYTIVASVFNRRNIVFFDGDSTTLKTSCRYLLAHELRKNQFSVVLNDGKSDAVVSVSAYGQELIDISYTKASINNKVLSLPYVLSLPSGNITVTRSHNGVCVNVNNDMETCCNSDSKSCTVAVTRWYTGRLNGLLGRSNYKRDDKDESSYFLDSSCKTQQLKLKQPTDEAIRTCNKIFGKNSRAVFRTALKVLDAVNDGWKDLCETIMFANPAGKCDMMKAFAYHARIKQIDLDVPNECYQCQDKAKSYKIGESVPITEETASSSDAVLILLPCENSKYSLSELTTVQAKFRKMFPQNKQNYVKVVGDDASVVQIDSKSTNLAYNDVFSLNSVTQKVSSKGFYKAMILAASILSDSDRVATRNIIIVNCGNCPDFDVLDVVFRRKLEKSLSKLNIVVSSWGSYNIVDMDSDSDNEIPIGYTLGFNNNQVVLYDKTSKKVELDDLLSYNLEHSSDLCSHLTTKTKGNIFNIDYFRQTKVNDQIFAKLAKVYPKHELSEGECVRVDTPFGDFTQVSHERTLLTN
jgi:hypothetical protein